MFFSSRIVGIGFIALGLSMLGAPSVLAKHPNRTHVKIEAKDIKAKEAKDRKGKIKPRLGVVPLSEKSLVSGHEAAIHPFKNTPDTKDTHTLRLKSK